MSRGPQTSGFFQKMQNHIRTHSSYRDPSISGWDDIAACYHDVIVGPFLPEMIVKDERGLCRNKLLNRLWEKGVHLKSLRIGDFGCGPGNLIPHLSGLVNHLTLLDYSPKSLTKACDMAAGYGMNITPIETDLRTYVSKTSFDLILSVNALQPPKRSDVVSILKNMRDSLAPGGEIFLNIPSFEALSHLIQYFVMDRANLYGIEKARKIGKEFEERTGYDPITCSSFFPHIQARQCLHSRETLEHEISLAGLKFKSPLQKVAYPRSVVKQRWDIDYPEMEEYWNWFCVLEKNERDK